MLLGNTLIKDINHLFLNIFSKIIFLLQVNETEKSTKLLLQTSRLQIKLDDRLSTFLLCIKFY